MSRKRLAPARWVLPAVVNPPRRVCFQIEVPDEPQHIAAFLGAIYDLAKPYKWANDNAHTAIAVGAVWFDIFEALHRNNCKVTTRSTAGVEDNQQMLRINPDNPCIIQQFCDPDWVDWFDASQCVAAAAGQQTGGGQPQPGQTACTNAVLPGNNVYLLPQQVSGGDIIQVTQPGGGWSDGSGVWQCWDGGGYALGVCTGLGYSTSGSDPLPSYNHAGLIMKINGVYYAATAAPFIVPSGVSNANVEFQMNDPSLSDNVGSIHFKVCLTASDLVVNLTGITGSGGSIAPIFNKTQVRVGEKFTFAPQFNSANGTFDGGFSADVAGTWQVTSLSNYDCGSCVNAWQWLSNPPVSAPVTVGTTSPASTTGWVGNSLTADSIEFELMSIP
jgi:hypothetical protein